MVIAGCSKAIGPIVLKAIGQYPVQSSCISLTTIKEIRGFFQFPRIDKRTWIRFGSKVTIKNFGASSQCDRLEQSILSGKSNLG